MRRRSFTVVGTKMALFPLFSVILDCPDAQLVSLRNQFQHLFDAIPAGSTARLRDFINLSDAVGVADFADKCLALFDH